MFCLLILWLIDKLLSLGIWFLQIFVEDCHKILGIRYLDIIATSCKPWTWTRSCTQCTSTLYVHNRSSTGNKVHPAVGWPKSGEFEKLVDYGRGGGRGVTNTALSTADVCCLIHSFVNSPRSLDTQTAVQQWNFISLIVYRVY